MDSDINTTDFSGLSPTYRTLTAERILDRFGIRLSQDELQELIQNPDSIVYQILYVPFKNILNGIVLQQAIDYQVYLQKLFIDYLVSGSGNETQAESPGESVRVDLEANRKTLLKLNESFDQQMVEHKVLICDTQAQLQEILKDFQPEQATDGDKQRIIESMRPSLERVEDLGKRLSDRRLEFKTLILDTTTLIQLLPDYRPNDELEAKNKESLQFDDHLGDVN